MSDAVDELVRSGVRARWVRSENWHVTLAFLGEVAHSRVVEVRETFAAAASRCAAFELGLSSIGAFPNLRRPRLVYVGGETQAPGFADVAKYIRSAFAELGFRFDDDAVVHVTVGRSDGFEPLNAPRLASSIRVPVRRLVLYESVPASGFVRYDELESVPLPV